MEREEFDVVVVGAGFAGLYALHRLRGMGLRVRVLERLDAIGGTWYANRYPGARCDVDSLEYSFTFSPELDQEWDWSERFAGQPEILAYLRHVVDRFDLARDIDLETAVRSMSWDADEHRWSIETEGGRALVAQFVLTATGVLSQPLAPPFAGLERFRGEWYRTSAFPHGGVDFAGKRVAVVGTGSSAVQAIPEIAAAAERLTVFQRTATFAIPGRNRPLRADELEAKRKVYPRHREEQRHSAFGFSSEMTPSETSALSVSREEALAELERRWEIGGAAPIMQAFSDVMLVPEANELVADFVRGKIRETVADPAVAELLCPVGYPIAAKRLCVENGYYEAFNRDNVTLVDVSSAPIEEVTEAGIRQAGVEREFDVIVFAIGFDAVTGALAGIDIRGRDGVALGDAWSAGPRTYLGIAVHGFPNLFIVTGPGSPSILAIVPIAGEQHVDWAADCIEALRGAGKVEIEPTDEAQREWTAHVAEVAEMTLFPRADSYYLGANVPGKPRVMLPYLGGLAAYRDRCDQVAANDYEGFESRGDGAVPSLPRDAAHSRR
jgi:cyclohexanone monooxygenase